MGCLRQSRQDISGNHLRCLHSQALSASKTRIRKHSTPRRVRLSGSQTKLVLRVGNSFGFLQCLVFAIITDVFAVWACVPIHSVAITPSTRGGLHYAHSSLTQYPQSGHSVRWIDGKNTESQKVQALGILVQQPFLFGYVARVCWFSSPAVAIVLSGKEIQCPFVSVISHFQGYPFWFRSSYSRCSRRLLGRRLVRRKYRR